MGKLVLLHFLLCFIFSSCLKQEEKITPLSETKTLAEIQKEMLIQYAASMSNSPFSTSTNNSISYSVDPTIFYLNLKYNLKDLDVFEASNTPNTFEGIAHSFLGTMAKIVLSMNGPYHVDLSDLNLDIPDLNLDKAIVKSIKIKKIFLQYSKSIENQSDFLSDFSFINTLELSQVLTLPKVGKVESLLVSYRKTRNNCMFKCMDFEIMSDNLIPYLNPNTQIKLKPTLTIASLPHVTDLRIDGMIELEIGLKLPF